MLALAVACIPAILNAQNLVFDEGLRFNEGTVSYKGSILVSNFGSSEFNPLNSENKGYIMAINGADISEFIKADGHLSAPKGMAIVDNHLYIADVGRVVVYNLKKLSEAPYTIFLPEGEVFVNDIAALSTIVLVTVTNTGNIYGIEATDGEHPGEPKLMGNIPGANGIAIFGTKIYVASYNPSGTSGAENVIYAADAIGGTPTLTPLIEGLPIGQYDGITLSEDGSMIYFSSWTGAQGGAIYSYNLLKGGAVQELNFGVKLEGPADILCKGGYLYVPDLPQSKLYKFKL